MSNQRARITIVPAWGESLRSGGAIIDLWPYSDRVYAENISLIYSNKGQAEDGCWICGSVLTQRDQLYMDGCTAHFWQEYRFGLYPEWEWHRDMPVIPRRRRVERKIEAILGGVVVGTIYLLLGGYLARALWNVIGMARGVGR